MPCDAVNNNTDDYMDESARYTEEQDINDYLNSDYLNNDIVSETNILNMVSYFHNHIDKIEVDSFGDDSVSIEMYSNISGLSKEHEISINEGSSNHSDNREGDPLVCDWQTSIINTKDNIIDIGGLTVEEDEGIDQLLKKDYYEGNNLDSNKINEGEEKQPLRENRNADIKINADGNNSNSQSGDSKGQNVDEEIKEPLEKRRSEDLDMKEEIDESRMFKKQISELNDKIMSGISDVIGNKMIPALTLAYKEFLASLKYSADNAISAYEKIVQKNLEKERQINEEGITQTGLSKEEIEQENEPELDEEQPPDVISLKPTGTEGIKKPLKLIESEELTLKVNSSPLMSKIFQTDKYPNKYIEDLPIASMSPKLTKALSIIFSERSSSATVSKVIVTSELGQLGYHRCSISIKRMLEILNILTSSNSIIHTKQGSLNFLQLALSLYHVVRNRSFTTQNIIALRHILDEIIKRTGERNSKQLNLSPTIVIQIDSGFYMLKTLCLVMESNMCT